MDWQDILISFLLNGVLLLIFRSIIQASHDREIAEITRVNTRELSVLDSLLRRMESFQSTRFQEIHTRRAVIIADFYKLLARAEERLDLSKYPIPYFGDESVPGYQMAWEKYEPIFHAVRDVSTHYSENKLFLTSEQTRLSDQIIAILKEVEHALLIREMHMHSPPADAETKKSTEEVVQNAVKEGYEKFTEVYPSIKDSLETSFRKLLGAEIFED